ncbi:MAG: hypothetical protein WCJ06_19305, partial [Planctomycetota bacterium]
MNRRLITQASFPEFDSWNDVLFYPFYKAFNYPHFWTNISRYGIGQAGHTAPKNHVAWWRISRSVLIAAEPSQSEQEVADGFSLTNIE